MDDQLHANNFLHEHLSSTMHVSMLSFEMAHFSKSWNSSNYYVNSKDECNPNMQIWNGTRIEFLQVSLKINWNFILFNHVTLRKRRCR